MNRDIWTQFHGKQVLLLQGPVGPFFADVAEALQVAGARAIRKVNFNGGDSLFYPRDAVHYRGTLAAWPAFLAALVQREQIDAIILYGDCRPIHRAALKLAASLGIARWVFEEGYVRPNYVTFERQGVNGYSLVPADPAFYAALPHADAPAEREVGTTFGQAAKWAMLYYTASSFAWPLFRRGVHHRPLTMMEGLVWVRSYWRKRLFARRDRHLLGPLIGAESKRWFLVPLQVARDSQVLTHSGFSSVESFLREVLLSFAEHAPADTKLVVKHHPLDRGYHDYTRALRRMAAQFDIEGRVLYVHDLHLPTLLEHARGVVVINSTVGMSALHHQTPVITLGKAVYNIRGLTFQGSLATFWTHAVEQTPDLSLYWKFRNYLVSHTQINGSFYKRLPGGDASGLVTAGGVVSAAPNTGATPEATRPVGVTPVVVRSAVPSHAIHGSD